MKIEEQETKVEPKGKKNLHETTPNEMEIAVAVSVVKKGSNRAHVDEHLNELDFLAETAHVDVVAKLIQERERPDLATVVGKGKLEELRELVEETKSTMVLFDDELSPAQIRNLERELKVKIIDRSMLILDIFATRAKSTEAKTQVELAQLQYLLPRLTRMWTHLSKQFGGVGTKGPGETQIETDRRIIKTRIQRLKEKLEEIDKQRTIQRKQRSSKVRYSLVGYTNAGKSTLMNALTEANVYTENKLFATLDTTVRQFVLPNQQEVLLSDTVGFIRKLPTHLVASFRSTLAESLESDMLLHVVDVSNIAFREHIEVVQRTLESLGIDNKSNILVFNKIDEIDDKHFINDLLYEYPGSLMVSAKSGANIRTLLGKMQEFYDSLGSILRVQLPFSAMKFTSIIYENAEVLQKEDLEEGVHFTLRVPNDKLPHVKNRLSQYVLEV